MQHHVLWHLLLWEDSSENWRDTGMAREVLTGIGLSSLCLWATRRALNSYCHRMDQCCLETMWSTSGFQFPVDKHLQHKASSGWQLFAFLVPNSGMQRHEYSPPCELATQEQHSKEKHSLSFPVLSTRQISAFRTDNLAPFIMFFGDSYICYVGQAYRIYMCYVGQATGERAQSRAFGTEDLTLTPRTSQGVLLQTKAADRTTLSSRRAVPERFFASVPCARKPAHELQVCKVTKNTASGTVRLKACFRPNSKLNMHVSASN